MYGNFNSERNRDKYKRSDTMGINPKDQFKTDFLNQGNLLKNNLNNVVIDDNIKEYSVLIDSKDRNYQAYPDPFHYEVIFNPLPTSFDYVNGRIKSFDQPNPTINFNFTNVKYIKLKTAILPLYTSVINKNIKKEYKDYDDYVDVLQIDTTKSLLNNNYTILSLGGEYSDANSYSTNDLLSNSFSTMYYDYKLNNTHYKVESYNGIKIFPDDQLSKITKLKIDFIDEYGNNIFVKHLDKNIKTPGNCECECECERLDNEADVLLYQLASECKTECFKHNLYHPLNPIFQNHLHFKVGVYEPTLSKKRYD